MVKDLYAIHQYMNSFEYSENLSRVHILSSHNEADDSYIFLDQTILHTPYFRLGIISLLRIQILCQLSSKVIYKYFSTIAFKVSGDCTPTIDSFACPS